MAWKTYTGPEETALHGRGRCGEGFSLESCSIVNILLRVGVGGVGCLEKMDHRPRWFSFLVGCVAAAAAAVWLWTRVLTRFGGSRSFCWRCVWRGNVCHLSIAVFIFGDLRSVRYGRVSAVVR